MTHLDTVVGCMLCLYLGVLVMYTRVDIVRMFECHYNTLAARRTLVTGITAHHHNQLRERSIVITSNVENAVLSSHLT